MDQNENLKEHPIKEETDQPGDSQGEKPAVSQKDLKSSTEKVVGHAVSAPQSTNVSEHHEVEHNLDLELSHSKEPGDGPTHPSQNADGSLQEHEGGGHNSLGEEHEIQNSGHSPEHQDQKAEHNVPQEVILDGDTIEKVQIILHQKLSSLENTLEQEDHNLSSPKSELGSASQKTDDVHPSSEKEDLNIDLFAEDQHGKESLLDEITKLVNLGDQGETDHQNRDGNKPHSSLEHHSPDSLVMHNNEEHSQNPEGNKVSVLISHEQGHTPDEELVLSLETERVSLNIQEEPEKHSAACIEIEAPHGLNQGSVLHHEDHTSGSAPLPVENAQSSVLPPSDQEVCTTLPCTDQVPSQSLSGSQNQVDQVQISQVLVIAAPGHEQRSSNSSQDPSASHWPGNKETSTAPESQPLLQKPQETDAHHGANTAETRDKSTPTKKKTCHCCVVM